MILFPNAKINIGLRIVSRRADGYHNIDTLMVPVRMRDILEAHRSGEGDRIECLGREMDCAPEDNLVLKAVRRLRERCPGLGGLSFILEKHIPTEAGLGGGSADAAFALRAAAALEPELGLTDAILADVAALTGADCPFFIYNKVCHATGTGTDIQFCPIDPWGDLGLAIAKPRCAGVSTREAYAGVRPAPLPPGVSLVDEYRRHPSEWAARGILVNDFEASVFARVPAIAAVKQRFLDCGAFYASMSGSGAAVYGIFADRAAAQGIAHVFADCDFFADTLGGCMTD